MDNLNKQLEEIKQARPQLYALIMHLINGAFPDEEVDRFLAMDEEGRKHWVIEQIDLMEV